MTDIVRGGLTVTVEGHSFIMELASGHVVVTGPARITGVSPGPSVLADEPYEDASPPGDVRDVDVDGYAMNLAVQGGMSSLTSAGYTHQTYEPPPALPVTLDRPGKTFTAIISQRDFPGWSGCGTYDDIVVIQRVTAAPTNADATPPPTPRVTGRATLCEDIDIAAFSSSLPVLSSTGIEAPPMADMLDRTNKPVLFPVEGGVAFQKYAASLPAFYGHNNANNCGYGLNVANSQGSMFLRTLLEPATSPDRIAALRNLVTVGRQFWECSLLDSRGTEQNGAFAANGGLCQFTLLPVMLYLAAAGKLSWIHAWMRHLKPNQFGHVWPRLWTQEDADAISTPHRLPTGQMLSRLRPVTAVDGTTVTTRWFRSNGPRDDVVRFTNGWTFVRASDGAEAPITSTGNLLALNNAQVLDFAR